jgi:fumarylpyruvate hydrolase
MSQLATTDGTLFEPQRVFCIGRNYVAHAREFHDDVPETPIVFLKPPSCLVGPGLDVALPRDTGSAVHYEAELVVLIGRGGSPRDKFDALAYVAGLSLGLDLTLRDLQFALQKKGLPWELSKAFDASAPVGTFTPFDPARHDLCHLTYTGALNDEVRQRGDTANLIFPIPDLLVRLGRTWSLLPGDLIYTGTPVGVGPLQPGDRFTVASPQLGTFSWRMV